MADGQFDECDLTLRDVEKIKEAFVPQLLGMYHQRIAYPQNKVVELESRRGRPADRHRGRDRRSTSRPWRIDVDDPRRGVDAHGGRCPIAIAPLARAIAAALDAAGAPSPASIGLILVRRRGARRRSTRPISATTARPTSCRSRCSRPRRSRPTPATRIAAPAPRAGDAAGVHRPARPADPPRRHRRLGRAGRRAGREPAAAARPATSAGPPPTSCACSSPTARSTSAAGITPIRPRSARCGPSSSGCSRGHEKPAPDGRRLRSMTCCGAEASATAGRRTRRRRRADGRRCPNTTILIEWVPAVGQENW